MKKIVALCKTFHGHELVTSAIESIYNYCDKIVFVHSNKSWTHSTGNTVEPVVREWCKTFDDQKKVINLKKNTTSQEEQYNHGWNYIDKNIEHDYKMMFDTDEVWPEKELKNAHKYLEQNQNANAFSCRMRTFLKSPFWAIEPLDSCCPMVFIKCGQPYTGIRGSGVTPCYLMSDVTMFHFSGVRESLTTLLNKIRLSSEVEDEPTVPERDWVEQVYNRLPIAQNLHWCRRYRETWKSIKQFKITDLPQCMRSKKFVLAWEKYAGYIKRPDQKKEEQITRDPVGPPKRVKYVFRDWPGSVCITTLVDKGYEPYAPLFLYCARSAYPEYEARVYVRGGGVDPELSQILTKGGQMLEYSGPEFPDGGYTTAAMRFVALEDQLKEFDYVLIQDADMLMYREDVPMLSQHMAHLEYDGTRVYENCITDNRGDNPRLPGVHFITKAWWDATGNARKAEAKYLQEHGASDWAHDEYMLGRIVRDSRLPLPPGSAKLWRHHGVHLGDWRLHGDRKNFRPNLDAWQSLLIGGLLKDPVFKEMAIICGAKNAFIDRTYKRWPMLFM